MAKDQTEAIETILKSFKKKKETPQIKDLQDIADHYFDSDKAKQEEIRNHYKVNGSLLINAVFNADEDTIEAIMNPKEAEE